MTQPDDLTERQQREPLGHVHNDPQPPAAREVSTPSKTMFTDDPRFMRAAEHLDPIGRRRVVLIVRPRARHNWAATGEPHGHVLGNGGGLVAFCADD